MGVGRIEKTYRRVGREGGKVQGNGLWGLQASINRVSTQYFRGFRDAGFAVLLVILI